MLGRRYDRKKGEVLLCFQCHDDLFCLIDEQEQLESVFLREVYIGYAGGITHQT